MIKIENDCLGCTDMGLMCLGSSCRYRNVEHHYCDHCGEELERSHDIYDVDGLELCEDCLLELFRRKD